MISAGTRYLCERLSASREKGDQRTESERSSASGRTWEGQRRRVREQRRRAASLSLAAQCQVSDEKGERYDIDIAREVSVEPLAQVELAAPELARRAVPAARETVDLVEGEQGDEGEDEEEGERLAERRDEVERQDRGDGDEEGAQGRRLGVAAGGWRGEGEGRQSGRGGRDEKRDDPA